MLLSSSNTNDDGTTLDDDDDWLIMFFNTLSILYFLRHFYVHNAIKAHIIIPATLEKSFQIYTLSNYFKSYWMLIHRMQSTPFDKLVPFFSTPKQSSHRF